MGTKLQELRDGCFHRAMDDEPMFVLLGRDPMAPALVRQWAYQRREEIKRGMRPATDYAQTEEALVCADRMARWRNENDGAWRTGLFAPPPEPEPVRIQVLPADEKHLIARQGDEYACTCGRRWPIEDGDEHP